jgi:hypothetical protein
LESKGIDVILGMGWLSKHKVLINCAEKYVKLTTPEGKEMEFIAEPVVTAKGVTNHAKVNQLVLASATTFITYHGVATATQRCHRHDRRCLLCRNHQNSCRGRAHGCA